MNESDSYSFLGFGGKYCVKAFGEWKKMDELDAGQEMDDESGAKEDQLLTFGRFYV
jgi:hypothetical protein